MTAGWALRRSVRCDSVRTIPPIVRSTLRGAGLGGVSAMGAVGTSVDAPSSEGGTIGASSQMGSP